MALVDFLASLLVDKADGENPLRSPHCGGAALFEGDVCEEGRERDASCCTAGCGNISELLRWFQETRL